MKDLDVKILATGDKWVGNGIRAFSETTKELIDRTQDSLSLTIFALSDDQIIEKLRLALERGVSVEIYLNYSSTSISEEYLRKLKELENKYLNLNVFRVENNVLHSKVIISDMKKAIVGSANTTFAGMVTNYELGVEIDIPAIAHKLEMLLRRLRER